MNCFFSVLLILLTFTSLVTSQNYYQLVAGNLTLGAQSFENVPGTQSGLNDTKGIWMDPAGNLHIAESGNFRIRTLDTNGIITTTIGSGQQSDGGGDGSPMLVNFDGVHSVTGDTNGDMYISSGNYFIWKYIKNRNLVKLIAGATFPATRGFGGDGGPASLAILNQPMGIYVDTDGSIYFADYGNNRIRKIDASGIITTIAGNGVAGNSGDGGPATKASLSGPTSLIMFFGSAIIFTDTNNNAIRAIDLQRGQISSFNLPTTFPQVSNIVYNSQADAFFWTNPCRAYIFPRQFNNQIFPVVGSSTCGTQQGSEVISVTDPISTPTGLFVLSPTEIYYSEKNIIRKKVLRLPSFQPTSSPSTETPTFSPSTLEPTFSPSTLEPTFSPSTVAPTFSPSTVVPTFSPSTLTPTFSPSTLTPTFAPSTVSPTHSPTLQPTNANVASSSSSSKSERLSDINIFYAVFFPALLVLIVLAIFLCYHCNKMSSGSEKDKERNTYEKVEKEKGVEEAVPENMGNAGNKVVERQRYYELWI